MRQIAACPLWIGHAGYLRDIPTLLEAGVEAVIELADSERSAMLPRELVHCRFPLADGVGNSPWLLRLAAETIAALLRARVPVLVCCSAGMSRSLCLCAAALALAEDMQIDEALREIVTSGPSDVSPGLLAEVRVATDH